MATIPKGDAIIMKKFLIPAVILVLAAFAGTTFYYYRQYQSLLKNPQLANDSEIRAITQTINRFMDLPKETPTLATITDVTALKDQAFFNKAKNGDKILIYPNDRKVVLFRPAGSRVIDVAPLVIGDLPKINPQPEKQEPIKVYILNGSSTVGLTTTIEKKLTGIEGIAVADKDNANKRDYPGTLVVDLTNANKDLADRIAKTLGAETSPLPAGEKNPGKGILIIAAK